MGPASKASNDTSALLTTQEVASLLRVHPKHVYRLLHQGIPARRAGGKWLFSRADVLAWARERGSAEGQDATRAAFTRAEVAPLIACDDEPALELLLDLLQQLGPPLVGRTRADRGVAVELVASGDALVGEWHGDSSPPRLSAQPMARLCLVDREVGLLVRPGLAAVSLAGLAEQRLAWRPPTSGFHTLVQGALRAAGLTAQPSEEILFSSTAEVGYAVASGRCDAGPGSRAWAEKLGLGFLSLGREPLCLVVQANRLGDPRVVRMCEVAQSAAFARELGKFAGYDVSLAGNLRLTGA